MSKHWAAAGMIAGVVAFAGFAGTRMVKAQQGQQQKSGPHVIFVHDVMHVLSQPVRSMKTAPPAYGVRKMIPLKHPMPLKSAVSSGPMDPALQTLVQPLVSTTNGLNFLGVGVGFQGASGDLYAPPDTNGSAGATQYVQWVNLQFEVFNKSTGAQVYGPLDGSTLFHALGGACASTNSGDIIAQYDKQAGRWVMMQPIFSSPYALCVAVSTSSDATGSYNEYEFSIPDGGFPDYPKLAVWSDGYYVSYNDFGPNGNSFISAYACALDRTAMLAGNSAGMQCASAGGYPSILPSDLDGDSGAPGTTAAPPAGSPDYYVDFSSTNALNLWKFHVDWTTPSNSTFTGPVSIPVASFTEACGGGTCVPQAGTNTQLDSLGDRLMYRFAYRNFGTYESLVVSQSVDTGSGNTGVRWYEIRDPESQTPTLYQQGTFAPDSKYRWMPSIAEDEAGDIALGYSVSSGTMYPSIAFTGRVPSDPLGTMESENSIVTGTGYQSATYNRWGDYSDMSIDPADDCTFWYTTEYVETSGSFNWSTRVASFKFPNCGAPGFSLSESPTSQTVTQGSTTGNYTVDVSPVGGFTGNVSLAVTSTLPAGMTPTFSGNPVDITGTASGSATLTLATTSSTLTGTYDLTVTGTGTVNGSPVTETTTVSVVVQAPPTPGITLASSGSGTASQGTSAVYTITVTPTGGYQGTVYLTASNLPTNATATFNPTSVTTSGGATETSQLTVTTNSVSVGSYTFNVKGADTSGTPSATISVGLTVQQPTSSTFVLAVSPTYNAAQPGSSATYSVTVNGTTPGDPYNGTVNLSVSGVPSRTSASFSTTSISGQGSSTLTLSPSRKATKGTYTLTITGAPSSGTGSTQTQQVTFVIGAGTAPSFTVSASPASATVTQGNTGSYTVTVIPSGGFTGSVSLSASASPSGVSPQIASSITITSASSVTTSLSIPTSSSTPTGTYTTTITGNSGSITQTAQVSLVVQSPGGSASFTVVLSPPSQNVSLKSSTSYTVTVTSLNGFSGTVSLSLGSLPQRTSGSLSSTSVTVSPTSPGTATLTISTTPKTTLGQYTITVTGTGGGLTEIGSGTLNVT